MRLGVRSKLFAASVALIFVFGLSMGLYLQRRLTDSLEERIEAELFRHAETARELIDRTVGPGQLTIAALDPVADSLGEATEARVTIIAPDGALLGDSELDPDGVRDADNHARRPEVAAALAGSPGVSQRFSTTVDRNMMYTAVPFAHPDGTGVVRVAKPLSEIDEAVHSLRVGLVAAGLIGLAVAIFMSGLASHFMSRTLRSLVDSARAIALGDARHRVTIRSADELAGLAGSLNRMADDIERTVAALASERAQFKAVLESMQEAVLALDDERRVRLMNPAAVELLGLDEAPLDAPLIDHVRAPALHALIQPPLTAGSAEFDLPSRGRRVLAAVTPKRDGSGDCIVVMRDVTELRRLERVRRDFVANVSHELRTPVSVIRANAEALIDGAKDDPVHATRLLEAVHRNAERLARIIADLLDLSRLEAGSFAVETELVTLGEAFRQALQLVERAAAAKEITLEVAGGEEIRARVDANALDQILINYLDNAINYTPRGGHVTVTATENDGYARIEVADDGPGIAPQHRDRIFERFYRVDPGRSRDVGGTGLGLSIVRHLAEAMDGTVGVCGNDPTGSIFWVELPSAAAV